MRGEVARIALALAAGFLPLVPGLGIVSLVPSFRRDSFPVRAGWAWLLGAAWLALSVTGLSLGTGLALRRGTLLPLLLLPAVVALLLRRRPGRPVAPFRKPDRLVLLAVAVGGLASAALVAESVTMPMADWDGRMQWGVQARWIRASRTVLPPALAESWWWVSHPRYPAGLAALEVAVAEAADLPWDARSTRPLRALFLPAALLVLFGAARRVSGTRCAASAVLLFAGTPFLFERNGGPAGSLADFPLAAFWGAGLFLLLRGRRDLAAGGAAGLLLAAAILTKNEGLPLSFLALAAGALVAGRLLVRRPGPMLVAAAFTGAGLAALLAFKSGVPNRFDEEYLSALRDPTRLAAWGRNLWAALPTIVARTTELGAWGLAPLLVPALLLAGRRAFRLRVTRILAFAAAVPALLGLAAYALSEGPAGLAEVTWNRFLLQGALPAALVAALCLRASGLEPGPLPSVAGPWFRGGGQARRLADRLRKGGLGFDLLLVLSLAAAAASPGDVRLAVTGLPAAVALVVALSRSALRLAGALVPGLAGFEKGVAAGVAGTALVVVPATLLGHVGLLSAGSILLAQASLLLLSRLVPAKGGPPAESLPAGSPAQAPERAVLALAVALLGAVVAASLWHDRLAQTGARDFDTKSYHLAAMATWREYGDLRMVKFAVGDPNTSFYPIASELVDLTLLAPLDPADLLARWGDLPFSLLALVAVGAVAVRLGASTQGAIAAAVLLGTLPTLTGVTLRSAGNDATVAFLLLAGTWAALLLSERPGAGVAALAGAALGLAAGTKFLGLVYALPVFLLACLSLLTSRRGSGMLAKAGSAALVVLAGAGCGGYTYLRNGVTTGNPFFPVPIRLPGGLSLAGVVGPIGDIVGNHPFSVIDPLTFFVSRGDLFGLAFPFLVLPAALVGPVVLLLVPGAGALGRGTDRLRCALVALLPALFFLLFLKLAPDHRSNRYLLAAVGIAAAVSAALAERLPDRLRPWARALLGGGGAVALALQLRAREDLAVGEGLGLLVVLLPVAWVALGRRGASTGLPPFQRTLLPAGMFLVLLVLLASPFPRWWLEQRDFEGWATKFDRRTRDLPGAVAAVGTNLVYALWGGRLQNSVHFVPANGDPDAEFYRWRGGLTFPRDDAAKEAWLRNLRRRAIRWVVVFREGTDLPESAWIDANPDLFPLVEKDGFVEFRSFQPGRPSAAGPPPPSGQEEGVGLAVDRGIPASVDRPAEGEEVRGGLLVSGWSHGLGDEVVEPVRFSFSGRELVPKSLLRTSRPDVRAAEPRIGDTSQAGWEAVFPAGSLPPGEYELSVTFRTKGGRIRTLESRRFLWSGA